MMQDERGLEFYKKFGYVPFNLLDESVTITLEYAYNDYYLVILGTRVRTGVDKRV